MAKRHHITFSTLRGTSWTVEIHDADHVGASTEINGRAAGFRLDYEPGQAQGQADMFAPVLSSSVRFDMLIEDAGMEAILTDLSTAREKRFTLVLYRDTEPYWIGFIIADEVRVSDRYYPYNLSIFAVDGIARLKEIDYKNPSTGVKYSGRETALQHFYKIIDILDLNGVVTMPAKTFQTNFNWYADSMAIGSGNNGLTQFEIDHVIFQETDNEGNEILWNAYEVLEALCRGLGGRFYFADGSWYFMQPAEYTTSTQTIWGFNSSLTQVGYNSGTSFDKAIDYAAPGGRRKLTGGSWTFLRAIKKVVVDYYHRSGNNRAEGVTFSNTNTGSLTTLPGSVQVDDFNESRLRAQIKMKVRTNELDITLLPAYDVYPPHRYLFLVTIKIGTYYLDSSVSGNIYNQNTAHLEWLASSQTVQLNSPIVHENNDNQDIFFQLDLLTEDLYPVMSGNNIQFWVQLDKVVDIDGNEITTDGALKSAWYRWQNYENEIVIEDEGTANAPGQDVRRFEAEDDTEGNTGIYAIDTHFGDGPFPFSLSRLTDGSAATENWGVGTNTGTESISMLLAKEVLNLRQTPAKVYQGVYLAADFHPYSRAVDLTEGFIPTRLSYSAYDDKWEGDFVKVAAGIFTTVTAGPFTPGFGNGVGPGKLTGNIIPVVGTTPPIVYDPNNSIINTTNTTVSPTTTAAGVVSATVNPTVTIAPVNYSFVKQGDTVKLFSPATGEVQTFTVAATPAPNATTLSLTGTASYNFPPGTFVQVEPAAILNRGFSVINNDFTGTVWSISTSLGILPQVGTVGADEMLRRIRVWRSGVRLFWRSHTSGDVVPGMFYTTTDRIIFYEKVRGERVFLEVVP